MDFYDRIGELLKTQKKNKKILCEEIGLSYSSLSSMFVRRSMNVDIEVVKKIASYLGVTLNYLLFGEEDKNHKSKEYININEVKLLIPDSSGAKEIIYKFDDTEFQTAAKLLDCLKYQSKKEFRK